MAVSKTTMRLLGWGAFAFSILPITVLASPNQPSHGSSASGYEETISGKIIKVGKDRYVVRTSDGDRVSLNITDDTNMKCQKNNSTALDRSGSGKNASSEALSSKENSSSSIGTMTQSKGFRIGDCEFEKGDRIRAKVDDAGDILYLTGRAKSSRDNNRSFSSSEDVPERYLVLPAGAIGGMEMESVENRSTLKTKEGEKIGNIIKMLSTEDGDLAYAIVRRDDGQMISVPWATIKGSSERKTSTLDIPKDQLAYLPVLEEGETSVQHVQKNWDLLEYDQDENSYQGFSRNRSEFSRNQDQHFSSRMGRERMRNYDDEDDRFRFSDRKRSSFGSTNRRDHGHSQRYERDIYEQDFDQGGFQREPRYSWRDQDSDKRFNGNRSNSSRRQAIFSQDRHRGEDEFSNQSMRERNRNHRENRDSQGDYDYRPDAYRN